MPLHLVAFAALFWSYERDLLSAHVDGSRLVLDQTIASLHPAMEHGDRAGFEAGLSEAQTTYGLEGMLLFDTDLKAIGGRNASPAAFEQLRRFLAEPEHDRVWLEKGDKTDLVHGLSAVRSQPECETCHEDANGVIAVAMMSWDVTDHLSSMRGDLLRKSGIVTIGWLFALGITTTLARRSRERSAASVEADLAAVESGNGLADDVRPNIALDPRSAQVHERMRRFLRRQHERDTRVAARMQHTDRLAAVGQLAAGLAHEIKNPLAGISGALELLRDGEFDGSPQELYGRMLEELERVDGIVKSLLDYARPATPRLVTVEVTQLVREVVELLRPSLRRNNIALQVKETAERLEVALDAGQIRQVLVNLITNAAEAIGSDGRIIVSSTVVSNGPSTVVIAVRDNGPGLCEEDHDRVFAPFFTTKLSGTGLGLSIAKSIVEQHGGNLRVDSQLGEGTTFAVVIPVAGSSVPASPGES